ncbi:aldo/keto reductase [Galbibacter pacificus]|uniref:Aldo/keto reductase n=1 Tax=Galbibacter pacificus TaxID=2996052 RepID=A0ABT6FPI2_9FLAO|nr:aldo/keto reductase [Galbibacter pacificus]MDG3582361.1 aldo/keto reductase [Galbibacter pacificus]MDG3585163.1 aldo/keto reductase [Galbibacter pacificus]
MKFYTLKNEQKLPAIGLGTWKSAPGEVGKAVIEALKAGYRHIDCAATYGNEAEVGEALKTAFAQGIVERQDIWVTSKLWNNAHESDKVIPALEKTLTDLQLNYLDLYLIHWPVAFKADVNFATKANEFLTPDEAPIIDTWKKMEEAYEGGLAKSIGVSNFSIQKLKDLMVDATHQPEVNQVELHPLLQQNELLEFCNNNSIIITGYSPLGSGDRATSMKKDNEPSLLNNKIIKEIANDHNCTSAQVLIAWHLSRGTAVIPKSTNPQRIKQNYESYEIELTDSDLEKIAAMDKNYRYVDGTFFEVAGGPYKNIYDE